MTNAYKTAVNEYMIQRGFEDADGNVLKPFHDRVIARATPIWPRNRRSSDAQC